MPKIRQSRGYLTNLNDLDDVNVPTPLDNQALAWDLATSKWIAETIAGAGESNTVSNIGVGGIGLYKQKVGVDLQFKNVNIGSNKITITDDPTNNEVDINIVEGNIVHQNLSGIGINTHVQIDTHITDSTIHFSDLSSFSTSDLSEGANLYHTNERVDDRVAALIQDGTGITWTYNDVANALTANCDLTWTELNKTVSDIEDITTRSHTSLTDIGINTHAQIDTHISSTSNPHTVTKTQVNLGNVDNVQQIPLSQKGAASGVAELDASTKVPTTQLPGLALTDVYTVASEAEQLALTAQEGDIAIRTDENKTYAHNGGTAGTMADWSLLLTPTDAVLSVFGRIGAVVATNNDYTWGQINKTTSDIADITTKSHTSLTDIGTNTHTQIDTHITTYASHDHSVSDPTQVSHADLTNTSSDQHHAQTHTIVSHDTTAMGAELDTLTDNSMADTLHRHSELSASDGTPDQALVVDVDGKVGIATASPTSDLTFGGGVVCPGEAYVSMDTTDGSDTGALHLGGGGTPLPTRGAGIDLYGNEQSTLPGLLGLHSGGNGHIVLLPQGTGNVGIGTASPNQKLTIEGTQSLKEQATANADIAAYGQIWVKSDTPNNLYFTDDTGNDRQIIYAGGAFHDGFSDFVSAEHISLPNTIANVLSDHTKATHDALNIDADTLDSLSSADFEPDITAGTTAQYWRGDKSWQTLLGTTSTTAFRGDYGNTAYTHTSLTNNPHTVTLAQVGGTTDHTALSNIGTNAHSVIDTHLANTDKHILHSGVSITAGTGMTGGGTIAATRTLNCSITQYTDALARASISETVTGLTYTSVTGVLSLTAGYVIPTTTQETNWGTAYTHSQIAGGNSVHVSTTENTQWDTAYTHSQIAGGNSVHVSTAENTNWDVAYSHISASGTSHTYINQSVTTAASPTFVRATLSQATGTSPLTVASTTKCTNLNADYLDNYHAASTSTANTIVLRNSSGDIHTRLFRSEYDSTNATCNYIMTQIDTASNNYLRPSTKAQLIASLALMKTTGGTFTGYVYARDHGTAATDMIVNVSYGTGNPPTANTTTIGSLFVKYT